MSEIFSKILKDKNGKVLNVGSMYQQPEWGAETAIVDILPETTIAIPTEEPMVLLEGFTGLVKGNKYIVNWNGTEHTYIAVNIQDYIGYEGTTEQIAIGNMAAAGIPGLEDDGNPYVIMTDVEQGFTMAVAFDGSTSATLSIKGEGNEIHAIPADYVEHAPAAPMVVTINISGSYVLTNYSYDEIQKAVRSGRSVLIDTGETVLPLSSITDEAIFFTGVTDMSESHCLLFTLRVYVDNEGRTAVGNYTGRITFGS